MSEPDGRDLDGLQRAIGHVYADRGLLERALVHSSLRAECDGKDNETLEFLGDAVLDLAIGDLLMAAHASFREGQLSKARAALVSQASLARVARRLGIGGSLQLGKGEVQSGGSGKDRILAGAYEAVIGALFLDAGYPRCRQVVAAHFGDAVAEGGRIDDPKTELQEITQKRFRAVPSYVVTTVEGPDHARIYEVQVVLESRVLARGTGSSRKLAEQTAAGEAVARLDRDDAPVDAGNDSGEEPA